MQMKTNSLHCTTSGGICHNVRCPDGNYCLIPYNATYGTSYFYAFAEASHFMLNLMNVETYAEIKVPEYDFSFIDSWAGKSAWWKFFCGNEYCRYTIDAKIKKIHVLTQIHLRSKNIIYVDESVQCIENALDACIFDSSSLFT